MTSGVATKYHASCPVIQCLSIDAKLPSMRELRPRGEYLISPLYLLSLCAVFIKRPSSFLSEKLRQ